MSTTVITQLHPYKADGTVDTSTNVYPKVIRSAIFEDDGETECTPIETIYEGAYATSGSPTNSVFKLENLSDYKLAILTIKASATAVIGTSIVVDLAELRRCAQITTLRYVYNISCSESTSVSYILTITCTDSTTWQFHGDTLTETVSDSTVTRTLTSNTYVYITSLKGVR